MPCKLDFLAYWLCKAHNQIAGPEYDALDAGGRLGLAIWRLLRRTRSPTPTPSKKIKCFEGTCPLEML